ncbi:MAG: phosphoglucosamine mutase [Gammaproteobacteria bacterium]|nr:MAG: phosphoglucosamine mutase [Gammaproteobacteria bacterium]
MHKKYFGTDGIRGRVGEEPITPEFILKLGWAAGKVLASEGCSRVIIGKDTRISGYMLESALESGFSAAGVDVCLTGPMPTPAVAHLTRTLRACAGIVISASHNPHYDNGIKFFSAQGFKLPDEQEAAIEAMMEEPIVSVESELLGKAQRVDDAYGRYIEFCKSTVPVYTNFQGLKIVVDCANGAAYHIAPNVFAELGAEVFRLGVQPDGFNINKGCGATSPESLQQAVQTYQADLGIALDGDADRIIMVDHTGEIVDGDEIVYMIARARKSAGELNAPVVGTVMSNLGLEKAIQKMGVEFLRVAVGDRNIMQKLHEINGTLGGESSGHVICLDRTTTGDGIVAALQVLHAMMIEQKSLSELRHGMQKFPQTMINVPVDHVLQTDELQGAVSHVNDAEKILNGRGRVLLRPSGTEPLVRVMVEGEEADQVANVARRLAEQVGQFLHSN